jgi:hypothetical protein
VGHQRHHVHLVLAHRLVGTHPGKPHRLQHRDERLERDAGVLAHLPVGPPRAHRPASKRLALQERKRQPTRPDRRDDTLHRQPGPLARGGQAHLGHIALQERASAVPSDQDPELDQPLDLTPRSRRRGRPVPISTAHPSRLILEAAELPREASSHKNQRIDRATQPVIPAVIPQATTAPNQTGLTRIVAQPDLARPD